MIGKSLAVRYTRIFNVMGCSMCVACNCKWNRKHWLFQWIWLSSSDQRQNNTINVLDIYSRNGHCIQWYLKIMPSTLHATACRQIQKQIKHDEVSVLVYLFCLFSFRWVFACCCIRSSVFLLSQIGTSKTNWLDVSWEYLVNNKCNSSILPNGGSII